MYLDMKLHMALITMVHLQFYTFYLFSLPGI